LRWPIAMAAVVLLMGAIFGSAQTKRFSIPPEMLNWQNLGEGFVSGIEQFGSIRFFSIEGIGAVVYHNLQVIILASLFGIFSFGVLGLIILMLPFGIIGYLTATAAQGGIDPWRFLLAFVVIPLLFFAAILEVYVTPHLAFWLFH